MGYSFTGQYNETTREVYFEDDMGRQIICDLRGSWSGNSSDFIGAHASGSIASVTVNTVTGPETYEFDLDCGGNVAIPL